MIRLLFALPLLLALAACSSTSQDTTGTATRGAGGSAAGSGQGALSGSPLGSGGSTSNAGVVPGSQEDLEINVGDRVFFAFDSAVLDEAAQQTLDRQALWLQQHGNLTVTIEGHADERGTREYNLALGERRAAAVKNYLVAKGIPADRILTISYGEERPVDPGHNESAWALNRRAVTVVNVTH
ncbi:Outer membrane lipoprotein Omp16 [bacterium HR40]|nr:Outer membrane lipoprotein Omp16 [bacterium HR40]